MSKQFVSAEPLTMVRVGTGETATMAYVFAGAPVPDGADPDDVQRLVDEGFLVEQEVADESAAQRPTKVEDILAAVGTDKVLAQEYLDEETGAEEPRSTLVKKLQAVISADA